MSIAPRCVMRRSAIIFDLDGTLTRPMLDFDQIRREIGIASGPILEALDCMTPGDRAAAEQVLEKHEREAAEQSILYEGAVEVVAWLRGRGCPVAILTRNARRWVDVVLTKHAIKVDAVRTREDGAIKPSAAPVLALCSQLGAAPAESWMIGDYLFDIQSGRQAGTRTVLMIGDSPPPPFAGEADYLIRRLKELESIMPE
ncbi:MAG: HAD family hydrolase [Phycisphaerales bacterium]|nr:HAD family hydrolase [Phycisphaerales bacterium]